jgi:hypothetical protein
MEQYTQDAHYFTEKALRDLAKYCRSPACIKWVIISH